MTNFQSKCARWLAGFLLVGMVLTQSLQADEGMWTFDNFPSKTVATKYGFTPSQAWLDHVRLSSLRIAGGCSASFISPQGLVMTNHHCVVECVEQLSTSERNFVDEGFVAKTEAEERRCPAFELDQLMEIRDVTAEVQGATAGKTGDQANRALHAKEAELQQSCGSVAAVRCDIVSLYHGGIYDLYRYKRYTDVRLVFAPEYAVAQFGGDPIISTFPRFDFDIGIVRAYEDGKPAASHDYLRWSPDGSKEGELVFVSGNPGGTSRELTMAQLGFLSDTYSPYHMPELAEYRGRQAEFSTIAPEKARQAKAELFFTENSFKGNFGRQEAFLDPQFMAVKKQQEKQLHSAVAAHPQARQRRLRVGRDRADSEGSRASFHAKPVFSSRFLRTGCWAMPSSGSASEERTKPNGHRLPEFTDQSLFHVRQVIFFPAPVYKDFEQPNGIFLLVGPALIGNGRSIRKEDAGKRVSGGTGSAIGKRNALERSQGPKGLIQRWGRRRGSLQ